MVASARIPLSTYRLQFRREFTFRDASAVVDYLDDLGISDCYASSYLKAVPGSPHGYDVADPTRLNPEVGTSEDYAAWIDAMAARGMGHVMDVVPNHMGIAKSANPWWLDVLENGASSRFAHFFDIEWRPVKDELADKVLIPILGDQYGEVLEHQDLTLSFADGGFVVKYFDELLPIAPDTFPMIFEAALDEWLQDHRGPEADELQSVLTAARNLPARSDRTPDAIAVRAREKEIVKRRLAGLFDANRDVRSLVGACVRRLNGVAGMPRTFDALDRLLNAQSYRLAHWRVASEEINYRRFFDINQLAALRVEDPAVFDEVHRFLFELVGRGAVTGLRIDHVDGLFNPRDYLRRLQERCGSGSGGDDRFYVVVEKILGAGEQLSTDWPVHGTTGYEFGAAVNSLFVDRRNERALDEIYRRFVRERVDFGNLAYRSKKLILHETLSGDINSLGHQLNRFSERNRHFRDFTLYSLISTIKEVIACFPVYRTYVTATDPIGTDDRRYILEAIRRAKVRAPRVTAVVFDFVQKLLLKQTAATTGEACEARARFIGKFQQITSPVAAKGIEDTAFYGYNRLISLNEVGSDPTAFGADPAEVHQWMARRQAHWPSALSATSTHDTKRGEDVRARINALSEMPGAWKAAVSRWRALNRRFKTEVGGVDAPDPNEEYLIYQTLVGMWPFDRTEEVRERTTSRLVAYLVKAMRESKQHTTWLSPDEDYERAVTQFARAILDRGRPNAFIQSFEPFQARVAEAGIYNSLSQLLIKITAPGVPDFYQGTELWDLTLVDPDNRGPVDYARRRELLAGLQTCATPEFASALVASRRDGRIKLYVTSKALRARAEFRAVYERGAYTPVHATGGRRECIFAFARGDGRHAAMTCVPRLVLMLRPDGAEPPTGSSVWGDTRLQLPRELGSTAYRHVFTGATIRPDVTADGPSIAAAALFEHFPVALLVPCSG
jgi:(1->4)-alpha-D-glucan 1-alpha-D-glucosylmutase